MTENSFKIGDIIINNKTKKIGKVTNNNYADGCILYHLIDTPTNIHICINPNERFTILKRKRDED